MLIPGIVLACLVVPFTIVLTILAVALGRTLTLRKPAMGVVVDNIEGENDGGKVWTPVVMFTDHRGRVQHGELDFHQAPARPLGSLIRVRFDPHNPTDVKQSARRLAIALALGCVALASVISVFVAVSH